MDRSYVLYHLSTKCSCLTHIPFTTNNSTEYFINNINMSLTPDAVKTLLKQQDSSHFQPILQVTHLKKVNNASDERYRLVLSDGTFTVQGLLPQAANHYVNSGDLQPNSIVKLNEYMVNEVSDRIIVIALQLQVLQQFPHKMGDPQPCEKQPWAKLPLHNSTNNSLTTGGGTPNPYQRISSPPSDPAKRIVQHAVVRSEAASAAYTPIADIGMFTQGKLTLRARVTDKSDVRTWSNDKGEGSLFSISLLDESNVDIRATFFKEAVDKFYNFLEVGKIYSLTGATVKAANIKYNTCKSKFELTFDHRNSEIHLEQEQNSQIQQQTFDFCKIADINARDENSMVDVLGVLTQVQDPHTIVSKRTGHELVKRDVTLMDDSQTEIQLTLWGQNATKIDLPLHSVVAARKAKVSDYNGKSLSLSGSLMVQPDIPEADTLKAWFKQHGSSTSVKSLSTASGTGVVAKISDRHSISTIRDQHLGQQEKPDWITVKGLISFIKKDKEGGAWYPACPNANEPCKNRFKVTIGPDQNWVCDRCQGNYPRPLYRWIFSAVIEDSSGMTWVSFFNEQAEVLLGENADEVQMRTKGENIDDDGYNSVFAKAQYTEWVFKCKVKQEIVNDEPRVKTSVYSLSPIDYVKESKEMLADLGL